MNKQLKKLVLTGLFIAIGFVLPFATAQIPQIGQMLLPMHIPVLICGFVCGWRYGLIAGLILPLFRSVTLGMPPMFPIAVAMSFELAAYGLFAGLFYKYLPKKNIFVYVDLILAMVLGRIVWGAAMFLLLGFTAQAPFSWAAFMNGAFITAVPGIILQLVLIPIIIIALKNARLMENA